MLMRIHEHLLDFCVTLFALSSLVLWGIILSGGTFNTYAVLVLLVPLVSAYLVFINSRGQIPSAPKRLPPNTTLVDLRLGPSYSLSCFCLFSFPNPNW